MELGVATFADVARREPGGDAARLREVVEEAVLVEEAGLDVFGLGEHHREDFAASAPVVALAAIAARTSRIRLTTAVTVLSSEDPVRVFEQFATLDGISDGRAEIMAGRGSFTESFPLFGYDLDDYDELFAEHLDLLLALRGDEPVTWSGRLRAPLRDVVLYPRPVQDPLPVWIAVGGTPQSVVRAGVLGLPLTIAIIGGEPARFAPLVDLYREAGARAGHDPATLKLAINTHGFVGETRAAAEAAFVPAYTAGMNRIGRERGWPPMERPQLDALIGPQGAVALGDPEQVAEKLLYEHELFGHDRFLIQMGVGAVKHLDVMRAIERFGTEVAPIVRAEVARRQGDSAEAA